MVTTFSRDRVLTALRHEEPDRVPFDMGSTQVTGISRVAHARLRRHLQLPETEEEVCDAVQQLALPEDDLVEKLGVDIRGLFPLNSHNVEIVHTDAGEYWEYHDEWGIRHHIPKENGLYYSVVKSPLDDPDVTPGQIEAYDWPDTGDPQRIAGLRQRAEEYRRQGKAVVLKGVLAGIFEMTQRIRGMENALVDLLANEEVTCAMFDKMLELKLAFWEMALPQLRDVVDVVAEGDDYGTQTSQLMSPESFRSLMKPRLVQLCTRIRELAPEAALFFHSCGSVRELIPDFIEAGIHILNPVHVTATGMEPTQLKRDFGSDLVFWGGGVDTQGILPSGTPQQVKDDVRRNVEALAPGGGYVFNTIHNIQPDVPPENIVAMVEALREY